MLSKSKLKYIRSLEYKKYRNEEKVFIAEGPKVVNDLEGHFNCRILIATPEWMKLNATIKASEKIEVSREQLSQASFLKTPQEVLAVFEQPETFTDTSVIKKSLCLALDSIQDPGNLGTIIRLADWFGIEHIFCSLNTADVYNPKTIQATMGAICRVKLHYCSLTELLKEMKDIPVYGTFLNGENLYHRQLNNNGIIVMGNEGNGISPEVESLISERLYIPNYPLVRETSESLNVAVATAIVCAEFRRQAIL